ncbi:hypothetical protein L596_011008 [Steinernema carpocapsae]|uniref:K Homology domain-containing protein n=1 Tax=Steinernema carpocapsae TaxID=34508 RepID=A0A4U5NTH0_STECR|nr:hypothetical protein L596_011008 [Steinernema carpocapsae]
MSEVDLKPKTEELHSITVVGSDQNGSVSHSSSLKRQNSDREGPVSKKAHISDSDESVQVKVLIPSGAVGAIIGKGGETMRSLKSDTGCRVQMSKNQEMYQGTNERICLVKGKLSSCMKVMEVIVEKIREKIDSSNPSDQFDLSQTQRSHEMKLVVANTSAGMVIGKSGNSIKEIRESTGANIQVFPKSGSIEAKNSVERVVTVASEDANVLINAVHRVLEKVAADPMHAQAMVAPKDNMSDVGGYQFGQNTGMQSMGTTNLSSFNSGQSNMWQSQRMESPFGSKESYGSQKFNPMQGLGNMELLTFLDNLQSTLRTSGFNEASVSEIMQAMQVLAKYNIMGLGLGLGVAAMAQMRSPDVGHQSQQQPQRYDMSMSANSSIIGGSVMDAPNSRYDNRSSFNDTHLSGSGGVLIDVMSQKKSGGSSNGSSFASSVIKEKIVESGHTDIEVPDNIVGAVLGPKAKTLSEIQHLSGANVEVHKRGSGTASSGYRLISLSGDAEQIRNARIMIEKVINDEQVRRSNSQQSYSGSRGYAC